MTGKEWAAARFGIFRTGSALRWLCAWHQYVGADDPEQVYACASREVQREILRFAPLESPLIQRLAVEGDTSECAQILPRFPPGHPLRVAGFDSTEAEVQTALMRAATTDELARLALEARQESIRVDALYALPTDHPARFAALSDPSPWVRRIAIRGLHWPQYQDVILSALADSDPRMRQKTVALLPGDHPERIRMALEDSDSGVRYDAVSGLSDVPTLSTIVADETASPDARTAAIWRLPVGHPVLGDLLCGPDAKTAHPVLRRAAIRRVSAPSILAKLVNDRTNDASVRAAALRRLPQGHSAAMAALEDPDREVRAEAVRALEDYGMDWPEHGLVWAKAYVSLGHHDNVQVDEVDPPRAEHSSSEEEEEEEDNVLGVD